MNVLIIGAGYVGLTTGICFADRGHRVTCVENDKDKLDKLQARQLTIHENDLDVLFSGLSDNQLAFSETVDGHNPDIIFVCVGTPQLESGEANLNSLWTVANNLRDSLIDPTVPVIIKSTVPVGTNAKFNELLGDPWEVCSNPEFLREGVAVHDCQNPARLVFGIPKGAVNASKQLLKVYADYDAPVVVVSRESAELIKYAANSMLAMKISFINEISRICDCVGADVEDVRRGISLDARIGPSFLDAGCGYGGSCFPKDVRSLVHTAELNAIEVPLLRATDHGNEIHKQSFIELALSAVMPNDVVAVWGVSFKPGTDDIRESISFDVIDALLARGAIVRVTDPLALGNLKAAYGEHPKLHYVANPIESVRGTRGLVLCTAWPSFKIHPKTIRHAATNELDSFFIVDGRNAFHPTECAENGIEYLAIGRF